MIVLDYIVAIISCACYLKGRNDLFLLFLLTLVSKYFYLLPAETYGGNTLNAANILVVLLCFLESLRNRKFFSCKNDIIGKCIILILLYFVVNTIFTVIFKLETAFNAVKIVFRESYLLYYFVFRKIRIEDLQKVIKPLFFVTILGGFLYYLQFLGVHLLYGRFDEVSWGAIQGRYMNIPALTYISIIYLYYTKEKIRNRKKSLVFLLPLIILPLSRGAMISFIMANIIYMYVHGYKRQMIKMVLPLGVIFLLFQPILETRFSGKGAKQDFQTEMKQIFLMKESSDFSYSDDDTFMFRIALFRERMEYLFDNPTHLLFGVGAIHEYTGMKRFNFYIGSTATDAKGNKYARQIETTDISYITHLFRYGILYIVFIFFFIYSSFKRYSKIHCIWATIGMVILLSDLIQSLSAAPFLDFSINRMFPLILFPAVLWNYQQRKADIAVYM